MSTKIHIVNFGQAYGGLTTVGYTILNIDGSTKVSRATTGIVEYGTATGIYGANITYNEFDQLVVLWDTGGISPRYAIEENRTTLASIQEGTDFIRMIWNTLKNQSEVFGKILKAVSEIEKQKDYGRNFKEVFDALKNLIEREQIKIKDIKEALNITVKASDVTVPAPIINLPAPIVHIPAPIVTVHPTPVTVTPTEVTIQEREINIPDYTELIGSLRSSIENISKEAQPIFKDLSGEIEEVRNLIAQLESKYFESHAKTLGNIGIVNKNIGGVGGALKELLDAMPPTELFKDLRNRLDLLNEQDIKDRKNRLKTTLRV